MSVVLSDCRVAVCIPYYRGVEGQTALSCMDLTRHAGSAGIPILPIGTSGCYIEDNREGCVEHALATGIDFTHLLWIDGDMIFPGDALNRLLMHDKDIVGANYRIRTAPYTHAGVYEDRTGKQLMQGGLHKMIQIPTGLLLTKFDIYRKMERPWFLAGPRSQPRDDIYFCRKAISMGYEIWCDHDLTKQVKHITVQEIGWFEAEQLRPVITGAEINNAASGEESRKRAASIKEEFEAGPRSAA